MTTWRIEPAYKKSIVEIQYWSKDDQTFTYENLWRWGSFFIETEDDMPPVLEEGIDMYSCEYDVELEEAFDSCSADYNFEDCDEDTILWLKNFLEDNDIYDLEQEGWTCTDTEMYVNCDLNVNKIND